MKKINRNYFKFIKIGENLLFYPSYRCEWIYHLIFGFVIIVGLSLNAARSIKPFSIQNHGLMESFYITEGIVLLWFSVEFCSRITIRCIKPSKGNILDIILNLHSFIDFFVINSLSYVLFHHWYAPHYSLYSAEILETLQFIQIYHFDYFIGSLNVLKAVILKNHKELVRFFVLILTIFFSFSSMLYLLERDQINSKINNIPDSIYFTIITYMTIGYGDIVPITTAGRLLVAVSAIVVVSLIIYPGTILVVGASEVMKERESLKTRENLQNKAAILIQHAWLSLKSNNSLSSKNLKLDAKDVNKTYRHEKIIKRNLKMDKGLNNIYDNYFYSELLISVSDNEVLNLLRFLYNLHFSKSVNDFKRARLTEDSNYPTRKILQSISELMRINRNNSQRTQTQLLVTENRLSKLERILDVIVDEIRDSKS